MGHVSMATRFCIWFEEPEAPPAEPPPPPPAPSPAKSSAAAAAIIEPLVEAAAPETRALATANPMTVGRFLYDEDAHEMILRLHFAGNVTIMRYKVLPSTGLRERSVTMCMPPPGDDGSGDVLPDLVTSHLDILDVCHGGRHGQDEASGGWGSGAASAPPSAALLDPSSPGAAFSPSAVAVRTSVVDFEGFGASVAARMGGLYQPCLSGVMFGTPFTQDAGGWVADGFASAQSCLRLSSVGAGERRSTLETRGYHFHPTLPSLPPDAVSALEQSFSRLAFSSTPTQRMPGLPMITAAGDAKPGSDGDLSGVSTDPKNAWLAAHLGVDKGLAGYPVPIAELLPTPMDEPLLAGGDVLAPAGVPGVPSSWAAAGAQPSADADKTESLDAAISGWTPDQRELFEALYGTAPPISSSLRRQTTATAAAAAASAAASAPLPPPTPVVDIWAGGVALNGGSSEGPSPPTSTPPHPLAACTIAEVSNDGADELPSPEQVEGFSRLFTTTDSSGSSS